MRQVAESTFVGSVDGHSEMGTALAMRISPSVGRLCAVPESIPNQYFCAPTCTKARKDGVAAGGVLACMVSAGVACRSMVATASMPEHGYRRRRISEAAHVMRRR